VVVLLPMLLLWYLRRVAILSRAVVYAHGKGQAFSVILIAERAW